jgi:hypothetical protein
MGGPNDLWPDPKWGIEIGFGIACVAHGLYSWAGLLGGHATHALTLALIVGMIIKALIGGYRER